MKPLATEQLRLVTGTLLIISAITHVSQLGVYGAEASVLGAAAFGILYFTIGVAVLKKTRVALIAAIIFPAIGGTLGIVRYFLIQENSFTIFHVGVDLIVIVSCIIVLRRGVSSPSTEDILND